MTQEKQHWESFKDAVSVSKAIWADEDKKVNECLRMITPALRSKLKHGNNILDLGCGNGRLLHPLSLKYRSVDFVGVDFSAAMLRFAMDGENIIYAQNDGVTIPFDDNYFHGGYSMIMFQHIPNENFAGYLKEVYRVLRPEGIFIFQFVEGVQRHFLSHHAAVDSVMKWVSDAGMRCLSLDDGIYYEWKWMAIQK